MLASNKSDALKSYDLSWLLHLVGDVHQPLHAITRFGHGQPTGDAGGNFVKICRCTPCDAKCQSKLHTFWDGLPGDNPSPLAAITYASKLAAADPTLAGNLLVSDWVKESVNDAQQFAYVDPILLTLGPFTITDTYRTNAQQVADRRVALAGARLAKIINEELK